MTGIVTSLFSLENKNTKKVSNINLVHPFSSKVLCVIFISFCTIKTTNERIGPLLPFSVGGPSLDVNIGLV